MEWLEKVVEAVKADGGLEGDGVTAVVLNDAVVIIELENGHVKINIAAGEPLRMNIDTNLLVKAE